jgi:co-chaperonin GroES (HSP10)
MADGREKAASDMVITGATLIVEVVELEEKKTSSGIILNPNVIDKGRMMRECIVLATGAGYYDDETKEDIPLDTKVGDVIFVEPAHLQLFYDFPIKDYKAHTIGVLNESSVKIRFKNGAEKRFKEGTGAL